jgi:RHS repeat-associated protein
MNGNLTSLQDTQGRTVTFTQNAAHQITTIKDSTGRTTTYAYSNPYLDLISLTNPNNEVTQFGYDSSDRVTSITDPNGKQTLVSYSSTGQVTQITDANTGQTKFTYNSGNTVVTDANTHATTYTYNSQLQVTKTTDANNHSRTSTYDSTNYNVTQTGDALSDFSNFTFSSDGRNNVTSDTLGVNGSESGAKTTFGYPSSGNNLYSPLSQTDPSGNVTSFAYDTNGNLTSAKDNNTGHTLVYTYNANGTVATQKDANGNLTTFGYDSKGNLTSITPPSPLGKTTLTVDGLSRVSSVTDGNTQKTSYTYDNADRVKTISYADSSVISYIYDKNGNVLSETDNTGLTSFQYDGLNRITLKTLPGGTTISMGYDNVGNLSSYNDGTGKVSYTYDAANRMTVLTEPDSSQTTYGYDNANRKTSIQYPNGTGMLMTYFATGQEKSTMGGTMSGGAIQTTYDQLTYSYMQGTNQTALLQNTQVNHDPVDGSSHSWAYTYTSENRLASATNKNGGTTLRSYQYTYDANGNRTQDVLQIPGQPTVTDNYTIGAGNELLTKQVQGGATTTYTYDGNGNLTSTSGGTTNTYNAKDQTTTMGSGNTYTYSGPDQRDRVQVNSTTFVYGTLGLTSEKAVAGTTAFVRCRCGLLNDERTPDGKKYYYPFDGLGSIVAMTNSTGAEVNKYDYDPYGNMISQTEQSGLNNPWKFAGGFLDSATGYYKYGIRYEDPTMGRWTQRTPVGGSLQETLNPIRMCMRGMIPSIW